ncbi:hypothetical protein GBA52_024541 [Prunus armeniaca]|nr:hypothetical protein GBA52_024541 [Prunus armeniaca]
MPGPPPKVPNYDHRKEDNSPSFAMHRSLRQQGFILGAAKLATCGTYPFTSLGFVGFLSLPPINKDAKSLFLNLIDYEMCPDFPNNFGVISYFRFLSSLIAKHLRSARVLCNLRGRDQSLADLFHEIGPDLVLAHPMYNSINAKLEKHYKTKWKAWFAQFFEDHFSSPWVMLAFIGTQPSVFIRNRVPYLHFQS